MTSPRLITEPAPPYGAVLPVHPRIRRVVAPNRGPMTYHGTSSWIVGRGEVAVIDPGPDDPAHREALLAAVAGEAVTHVILTHGHKDHAAGAAAFAASVGARSWGFGRAAQTPFVPDVAVDDGAEIEGEGWRLTAIHTPGHASDHLCFALAGEGVLFSGDHVMGWATSVVSPPDGDARMSPPCWRTGARARPRCSPPCARATPRLRRSCRISTPASPRSSAVPPRARCSRIS